MQLAEVLRRFGLYPLLRELCTNTLGDIHESDERLAAQALNELGNIAYLQGDYQEARRLFGQSLEIFERLGDQSGRATTLGQLGLLAYEQGDFEQALTYLVQAYILFDALHSPSRHSAQSNIAMIRSHMDEATFAAHWRTIAGDRPLPILPAEETNQQLLQVVIEFMQVPTWGESKRFLESHLELLQPEIDGVLQALAAQQEHEGARKTVEEHHLLLAGCRDKGIDVAFAEHLGVQSPETENTDEDEGPTVEELPGVVSSVILQGTAEQRQQLATVLTEAQEQLPPEGAALGRFFGCLAAALRGETPEVEALEAPFTELWQVFQDALRATPDE